MVPHHLLLPPPSFTTPTIFYDHHHLLRPPYFTTPTIFYHPNHLLPPSPFTTFTTFYHLHHLLPTPHIFTKPLPHVPQVSLDESETPTSSAAVGGVGRGSPHPSGHEWVGSSDSLHLGNRRPSWNRSVSKNTLSSQSQGGWPCGYCVCVAMWWPRRCYVAQAIWIWWRLCGGAVVAIVAMWLLWLLCC